MGHCTSWLVVWKLTESGSNCFVTNAVVHVLFEGIGHQGDLCQIIHDDHVCV